MNGADLSTIVMSPQRHEWHLCSPDDDLSAADSALLQRLLDPRQGHSHSGGDAPWLAPPPPHAVVDAPVPSHRRRVRPPPPPSPPPPQEDDHPAVHAQSSRGRRAMVLQAPSATDPDYDGSHCDVTGATGGHRNHPLVSPHTAGDLHRQQGQGLPAPSQSHSLLPAVPTPPPPRDVSLLEAQIVFEESPARSDRSPQQGTSAGHHALNHSGPYEQPSPIARDESEGPSRSLFYGLDGEVSMVTNTEPSVLVGRLPRRPLPAPSLGSSDGSATPPREHTTPSAQRPHPADFSLVEVDLSSSPEAAAQMANEPVGECSTVKGPSPFVGEKVSSRPDSVASAAFYRSMPRGSTLPTPRAANGSADSAASPLRAVLPSSRPCSELRDVFSKQLPLKNTQSPTPASHHEDRSPTEYRFSPPMGDNDDPVAAAAVAIHASNRSRDHDSDSDGSDAVVSSVALGLVTGNAAGQPSSRRASTVASTSAASNRKKGSEKTGTVGTGRKPYLKKWGDRFGVPSNVDPANHSVQLQTSTSARSTRRHQHLQAEYQTMIDASTASVGHHPAGTRDAHNKKRDASSILWVGGIHDGTDEASRRASRLSGRARGRTDDDGILVTVRISDHSTTIGTPAKKVGIHATTDQMENNHDHHTLVSQFDADASSAYGHGLAHTPTHSGPDGDAKEDEYVLQDPVRLRQPFAYVVRGQRPKGGNVTERAPTFERGPQLQGLPILIGVSPAPTHSGLATAATSRAGSMYYQDSDSSSSSSPDSSSSSSSSGYSSSGEGEDIHAAVDGVVKSPGRRFRDKRRRHHRGHTGRKSQVAPVSAHGGGGEAHDGALSRETATNQSGLALPLTRKTTAPPADTTPPAEGQPTAAVAVPGPELLKPNRVVILGAEPEKDGDGGAEATPALPPVNAAVKTASEKQRHNKEKSMSSVAKGDDTSSDVASADELLNNGTIRGAAGPAPEGRRPSATTKERTTTALGGGDGSAVPQEGARFFDQVILAMAEERGRRHREQQQQQQRLVSTGASDPATFSSSQGQLESSGPGRSGALDAATGAPGIATAPMAASLHASFTPATGMIGFSNTGAIVREVEQHRRVRSATIGATAGTATGLALNPNGTPISPSVATGGGPAAGSFAGGAASSSFVGSASNLNNAMADKALSKSDGRSESTSPSQAARDVPSAEDPSHVATPQPFSANGTLSSVNIPLLLPGDDVGLDDVHLSDGRPDGAGPSAGSFDGQAMRSRSDRRSTSSGTSGKGGGAVPASAVPPPVARPIPSTGKDDNDSVPQTGGQPPQRSSTTAPFLLSPRSAAPAAPTARKLKMVVRRVLDATRAAPPAPAPAGKLMQRVINGRRVWMVPATATSLVYPSPGRGGPATQLPPSGTPRPAGGAADQSGQTRRHSAILPPALSPRRGSVSTPGDHTPPLSMQRPRPVPISMMAPAWSPDNQFHSNAGRWMDDSLLLAPAMDGPSSPFVYRRVSSVSTHQLSPAASEALDDREVVVPGQRGRLHGPGMAPLLRGGGTTPASSRQGSISGSPGVTPRGGVMAPQQGVEPSPEAAQPGALPPDPPAALRDPAAAAGGHARHYFPHELSRTEAVRLETSPSRALHPRTKNTAIEGQTNAPLACERQRLGVGGGGDMPSIAAIGGGVPVVLTWQSSSAGSVAVPVRNAAKT